MGLPRRIMGLPGTILLGCALIMIPAGCQGSSESEGPVRDMSGERAALLEVDREFADLSESVGYIEAYYRYSADEILLLPPGIEPMSGREDIYREDSERGLQGQLTWKHQDGRVASSGELGWTWGRWVFTVEDEEGNPQVSFGKYVFLWGKRKGQWKVTVNIWNDNPEPVAP